MGFALPLEDPGLSSASAGEAQQTERRVAEAATVAATADHRPARRGPERFRPERLKRDSVLAETVVKYDSFEAGTVVNVHGWAP